MNDKQIIEKQAELINWLSARVNDLESYTRYNLLKSELALLEQNEGKEECIDDITGNTKCNPNYPKGCKSCPFFKDHSASPTMSKPSDCDIENAALDYVDEESNHFAR